MLHYITGNKSKIETARKHLTLYGIQFKPQKMDFQEIQSHSLEEIVLHKAKQAFDILQQPLLVSDSGWYIKALNNFPGPYMRYINEWFTTQDFINLLKDKKDRTVIIKELYCYIDKKLNKTFVSELTGTILYKPQGIKGSPYPFDSLASFAGDDKSMAERALEKESPLPETQMWKEFAEWYKTIKTNE